MRKMTLSNHLLPTQGRSIFQTSACTASESTKLQGRYEAAKSLNILRLNIQSLINKEIDTLLKTYLDKFFQPAIVNIRSNLGEDSVTENNLRMLCIQMLDDAKGQYFISHTAIKPIKCNKVEKTSFINHSTNQHCFQGNQTDFIAPEIVSHTNDLKLQYFPSQSSSISSIKKKEESDCDSGKNKKKIMRTVTSILPGVPTPIKLVKLEGIRRDGPKWDPNRITNNTFFIMGARANKVLGFGQTRGRLYTKHPELFKYSGDTEDKEWLSRNNLMPPTGGIAYLLVLDDIKELAESEDYWRNPNVLLHELKGFLAPDFMLVKIRTFIAQARTEGQEDFAYQCYDPSSFLQGIQRINPDVDNSFRPNVYQSSNSSNQGTNLSEFSGSLMKFDNYQQNFSKPCSFDGVIRYE